MLRTRQKVVRGTVSPLDVGRPDGDEVDLPAGEWGITAGGIGAVGTTTCTVVEARPGPSITIAPESGERNSTATVIATRGRDPGAAGHASWQRDDLNTLDAAW